MNTRRAKPVVLETAVVGLAWLVRFGFMARWGRRHAAVRSDDLRSVRQVYDGHERLLFEAFIGEPPTPSPQAWPLSVWLHQALGWWTTDPRAPLLLSTVLGAVTAGLVARAVRERAGVWSGVAAGLLVAVLPEHVAWSTSAVPVVHGLAALSGAVVCRHPAARALLAGLAAACRPELALPAVFLGTPGLAAVAVAVGQLAWLGGPPGAPWAAALRVNIPLVYFLGPVVLLVSLVNLRDRATALLALAAASVHLVGACFSDYGARHGLAGGLALCVLAAWSRPGWWRLVPVVVGVGLLPELWTLRAAWHTKRPTPTAQDTVQHTIDTDACTELTDEPPVPGQPRPSWLSWVDSPETAPCITWGEAPEHTAWSSRGLRDRARRMRSTWTLEPVAVDDPGRGRPWRVTWHLASGPGTSSESGVRHE